MAGVGGDGGEEGMQEGGTLVARRAARSEQGRAYSAVTRSTDSSPYGHARHEHESEMVADSVFHISFPPCAVVRACHAMPCDAMPL